MTKRNFLLSLALVVCTTLVAHGQQATQAAADLDYQTAAVLYMQKAAEYRALAYQAFNVARMQLDADTRNMRRLPRRQRRMPRAIVVDIDETVLDNSPAQAYGIKNNVPFNTKDWYAWGEMRKARAIPGSLDFLNYAVSRGVKVFYISNRDEVQKQATIDNLKTLGFRDISTDNVMLRTTESSKDARRAAASARHRVVMLVGDNLDDFTSAFERKSIADRFSEVEKAGAQWGTRFIVLPNAMYGTWENAIYEYQRLTEAQKAEKRAAALELP